MKIRIYKGIIAAAISTLVLGSAMAQDAETLPPIQKIGDIECMSGGISKDESMAIERISKQWPLTLEFAIATKNKNRAEFASGVSVVVRHTSGQNTLETISDGPFLLAKLAPGRYTVDATLAGKTLHKTVVIKSGQPAKVLMVWPVGTDEGLTG